MLPFIILCCATLLVNGQVMTLDDQVPDTLQMYQVLDERAENIAQIAQDLGAAIDALRSGRTREFLKSSMSVQPASVPETIAASMSMAEGAVTPAATRSKRSYYGGSSYRRYGSYGGGYNMRQNYGYGRSYGGGYGNYGMNSYNRGGYGGYGYGRYG